jgi:hypothetical protein
MGLNHCTCHHHRLATLFLTVVDEKPAHTS